MICASFLTKFEPFVDSRLLESVTVTVAFLRVTELPLSIIENSERVRDAFIAQFSDGNQISISQLICIRF
jgi:hypothetical protein